jgi:hypothetical protein
VVGGSSPTIAASISFDHDPEDDDSDHRPDRDDGDLERERPELPVIRKHPAKAAGVFA